MREDSSLRHLGRDMICLIAVALLTIIINLMMSSLERLNSGLGLLYFLQTVH